MSDYDPTNDPRYVPIMDEMPAEERAMVEEELFTIEENIKRLDTILLMFASPGWDLLVEGFERVIGELDTQLKKEQDQSTWKFYRGQMAQVEWFEQLPGEMADNQRRLRRDHASLLQMLGKE